MTEHDYNGHRIKPGHDGQPYGHPTGPYRQQYVWLLCRHDDKLYGYWESRHDAVGAATVLEQFNRTQRPEWFEPVRVPVGSARTNDVIELCPLPDREQWQVEQQSLDGGTPQGQATLGGGISKGETDG